MAAIDVVKRQVNRQYIHAWNQRGTIISNYDIFLLQFLFCKNTVNLEEYVAAIVILFGHSSNEWMQLELWVNLIPLKKGITASTCFKETEYPSKY